MEERGLLDDNAPQKNDLLGLLTQCQFLSAIFSSSIKPFYLFYIAPPREKKEQICAKTKCILNEVPGSLFGEGLVKLKSTCREQHMMQSIRRPVPSMDTRQLHGQIADSVQVYHLSHRGKIDK